jgi:hypothetical protein
VISRLKYKIVAGIFDLWDEIIEFRVRVKDPHTKAMPYIKWKNAFKTETPIATVAMRLFLNSSP